MQSVPIMRLALLALISVLAGTWATPPRAVGRARPPAETRRRWRAASASSMMRAPSRAATPLSGAAAANAPCCPSHVRGRVELTGDVSQGRALPCAGFSGYEDLFELAGFLAGGIGSPAPRGTDAVMPGPEGEDDDRRRYG